MQAAVLDRFGGPEVLVVREVPDPVAGPNQVLLKVGASGVCGFDGRSREGLPGYGTEPGVVLGHEFAGTVVAVGQGVGSLKVGDRVTTLQQGWCAHCEFCLGGRLTICPHYHETTYGSVARPGGYAELVAADVATLEKVPDGVDDAAAAIAGCAIGVALHALRRGRAQLGEHVMVTGASGGLGVHALQLARAAGCEVTAVTSSESMVDALRGYADHVALLQDGSIEIQGRRPDLVIDNAAGYTLPATLRAVKRGGRVVVAGMVGTNPVPFFPGPFFAREIELIGSNATTKAELREVLDLLSTGKIEAVIADRLPLSGVAAAHALLDSGGVFGRLVLAPELQLLSPKS